MKMHLLLHDIHWGHICLFQTPRTPPVLIQSSILALDTAVVCLHYLDTDVYPEDTVYTEGPRSRPGNSPGGTAYSQPDWWSFDTCPGAVEADVLSPLPLERPSVTHLTFVLSVLILISPRGTRQTFWLACSVLVCSWGTVLAVWLASFVLVHSLEAGFTGGFSPVVLVGP